MNDVHHALAKDLRVAELAITSEQAFDPEARKRRALRRSPLVAAGPPGTLEALAAAGTVVRVLRGRVLAAQGEPATSVAFLGSGRVRLARSAPDGRSLALGYRGAGDLVGEAALLVDAVHRESAVCMDELDAVVVPAQAFRELVAAGPALVSALVATFAEGRLEAERRLASVLFRNVEGRLAEFLLDAARRWGVPDARGVLIGAPFTHQEIAAVIGSTRETVTLALGDLRRRGIVAVDRRRIVVVDREALARLS